MAGHGIFHFISEAGLIQSFGPTWIKSLLCIYSPWTLRLPCWNLQTALMIFIGLRTNNHVVYRGNILTFNVEKILLWRKPPASWLCSSSYHHMVDGTNKRFMTLGSRWGSTEKQQFFFFSMQLRPISIAPIEHIVSHSITLLPPFYWGWSAQSAADLRLRRLKLSLTLKGTSQHTANTRTQLIWLKGSRSDLQYTLHNILS